MDFLSTVDLIAIVAAIGGATWFVTNKIDSGFSRLEAKIENILVEINEDKK